MKLRNKTTGIIINSSIRLSNAWEVLEDKKEDVKNKPMTNNSNNIIEVKEIIKEDAFNGAKRAEIIQELKALGKDYNPNASTKELYYLMFEKRW